MNPVPHHPDGKKCSDCVHIKRCRWLLSYTGDETQCDWTPSRFKHLPGLPIEVKP